MIKLYKRIEGILHYHEAWLTDGVITEHWGRVGERGASGEHQAPSEVRRVGAAVGTEIGHRNWL
jgi:hypothetical protein